MKRVLIVGLSTRAAAESAARAGFDVTAIDASAISISIHRCRRLLCLAISARRALYRRGGGASRAID
jgi:hypothetical protein